MESQAVTEQQSDVLVKELISRYTAINDDMSELLKQLNTKHVHPDTLTTLSTNLRFQIIGFVGIAQTKEKFYQGIESVYLTYINLLFYGNRRARYNAESTVEIWEIIKKAINVHKLIELNGG